MSVELLSDCGLEFDNQILTEICKILGIKKLRTSGYRPQTNACIERYHRVFNTMLAKVISQNQKDWWKMISYAVFAYNATCHSATNFTPFFLMTGRQVRWTVDMLLGDPGEYDRSVPEYAQEVREQLLSAYEVARKHLQAAATVAANWYDKRVRPQEFFTGDRVRLYCPRQFVGKSAKLQSNYSQTGEIVAKVNQSAYLVKTAKGSKIYHADKIKLLETYPM